MRRQPRFIFRLPMKHCSASLHNMKQLHFRSAMKHSLRSHYDEEFENYEKCICNSPDRMVNYSQKEKSLWKNKITSSLIYPFLLRLKY